MNKHHLQTSKLKKKSDLVLFDLVKPRSSLEKEKKFRAITIYSVYTLSIAPSDGINLLEREATMKEDIYVVLI